MPEGTGGCNEHSRISHHSASCMVHLRWRMQAPDFRCSDQVVLEKRWPHSLQLEGTAYLFFSSPLGGALSLAFILLASTIPPDSCSTLVPLGKAGAVIVEKLGASMEKKTTRRSLLLILERWCTLRPWKFLRLPISCASALQ